VILGLFALSLFSLQEKSKKGTEKREAKGINACEGMPKSHSALFFLVLFLFTEKKKHRRKN